MRSRSKHRRFKVYIACPITKGNLIANCRNATLAWNSLVGLGYAPFNPAANDFAVFMASGVPPSYEDFMETDAAWLKSSDAVLRIPGESAGAEREIRQAKRHGIPVFYSLSDLNEWRLTKLHLNTRRRDGHVYRFYKVLKSLQ